MQYRLIQMVLGTINHYWSPSGYEKVFSVGGAFETNHENGVFRYHSGPTKDHVNVLPQQGSLFYKYHYGITAGYTEPIAAGPWATSQRIPNQFGAYVSNTTPASHNHVSIGSLN